MNNISHDNLSIATTITVFIIFVIFIIVVCFQSNSDVSIRKSPKIYGTFITLNDIDIYLINLDRHDNRLASFVDMYTNSDLASKPFNRLRAFDASKLDVKPYVADYAYNEIMTVEKNKYRTKHYQMTKGGVGCFLSHLGVYNNLMATNKQYALIFEDDANFDKNIFRDIQLAMEQIPADWDIALFGCKCLSCSDNIDLTWDKVNRFFCLHCYLISRKCAQKLLKNINMIDQQIDSYLSDLAGEGNINIYCLKKPIAVQGLFKSSIQVPIEYSWDINPMELRNPLLEATTQNSP